MEMNTARGETGWRSGEEYETEVGEEGFNSGFVGTQGSRNLKLKSNSMSGRSGFVGSGGADVTDIPIRLLDSFLPGYSIVSALILETFGFDISKVVGSVFVLLTFLTATRYVWKRTWSVLKPWCSSVVFLPFFFISLAIQ